ncbi:hypothetical protein FQA39_LY02335 [Lamprigera yunnana]|nr:hypothetical protein FQA39_LY02335 [Lamprigera yunnana]
MIGNLWQELNPQVIQNGFRKGWIVPFNRNIISADKYDPLAFQRWQDYQKSQNLQFSSNSQNGFETHISVASTSGIDLQPNSHVAETSFKALLLSEIKQKDKNVKQTRKQICRGAEVITASKKPYESENTNETAHVETSDTNNTRTVKKGIDKSDLGTLEDLALEYNAAEEVLKGIKDVAEKTVGDRIVAINNRDDETTINFLRKKLQKRVLKTVIASESIVCILPEPKQGRRDDMCFRISFWRYSLQ